MSFALIAVGLGLLGLLVLGLLVWGIFAMFDRKS